MSRHGKIVWSELMTRNIEKSIEYYERLAGWRFDKVPLSKGGAEYEKASGDAEYYYLAKRGRMPVAGMMDMSGMHELRGIPAHWMTYVGVADIEKAVADIKALGGSVKRDIFSVPNMGRIAILQDPDGAVFGVMQQDPMTPGRMLRMMFGRQDC